MKNQRMSAFDLLMAEMSRRGWKQREFIERYNAANPDEKPLTEQAVSNWKTRREIPPGRFQGLARTLSLTLDKIAAGEAPPWRGGRGGLLAQEVIHEDDTIGVGDPVISWEGLLQLGGALPVRFKLVVKDESMPPMKPGHRALFERASKANIGDVVLVKDKFGEFHIRDYAEKRKGSWQAVARQHFLPLDAVEDGLEIVAVQKGHEWD